MKIQKESEYSCRPIPLAFPLLLLLILVLSGCEKCSPPQELPEETKPVKTKPEAIKPVEINLKETRLATILDDYDTWRNIYFSADGRRVFYRAMKRGRQSVVVNDKAGRFYEAINDMIVFSSDGKKVAYDGKRDEKEYLVIDGKEVRSYDDVAPGPFSPDGRLLACQAEDKESKEWFIVVSDGDKEIYRSQAFPDTYRYPVFSPDGRLLVFELGDDKRGIGSKKRTVFFLDLSAKKIIKERLCVDCQRVSFSFSSDSTRVIHVVRRERKYSLVLQDFISDEEREIELPYDSIRQVSLSPDGKKIIYIANKEGKHFLVLSRWDTPAQGEKSAPYEGIGQLAFSLGSTPDATIAYLAMKEGKWRSVVGDKEGTSYDKVGRNSPVWSPDGARIAHPAMKNGKWVMVVSQSNKPKNVAEGPVYDMVVTPVWSADGRYLAYRAREGTTAKAKRFIVIDDTETGKVLKEGPVYDEVWPPVWSADSTSVGYGVRIGRELWWKVEVVP
jgi:Tol biopolymer transport system component